jgi:SAM-dependent methyltransferase
VLTVDYARLGVLPGDKVLDLGCGFGRHAYQAARLDAQVVAFDFGADEVRNVRDTFGAMADAGELDPVESRVGAVQGDALALPFPDDAFDRVIASEILEHIPDDEQAMRELARVLRPGGTMAITVPRAGPEFINWTLSEEYHNVPGGHVRIYRQSQLVERLEAPACRPPVTTTPMGCTLRTGGSSVWSAPPTTRTRRSPPTTDFWCGTSRRPRPSPG